MPLPPALRGRLRLPAIVAPMFLVSGPDMIVEACRSGLIAAFPALNQRTTSGYDNWLADILPADCLHTQTRPPMASI